MNEKIKNFSNYCTQTRSPLSEKQLKNDVASNVKSQSSSEVSDNGFCDGKNGNFLNLKYSSKKNFRFRRNF